MKSNLWTKTTLSVYKYLDRIAEAMDKLVERKALNSYYIHMANNGVMDVANEIIELSERKKRLINIKVATERALEEMDKLYAQILIEKYIDNDKGEDIALRHNLSIRTYFRRQNQAEDYFTSLMSKQNFSEARLSEYLACENWIIKVYNKYQKEQEDIDLEDIAII